MTNNDELALKPGTYAILFRDNWDGQGDVYKTLATLSDDLVWYHHENGRSLIEYEGDEVLKVWPLDDGSNVLALLAERDADKKRIGDMQDIVDATEKLVRCKGRYHSEQNYRALAALFGVKTPDLPPLETEVRELELIVPPRRCFDYAALAVQERDEQWHKALHDACKRAGIKLEVGE